MNNLLMGLVSIGLIAIMVLMIVQIYHFRKQLRFSERLLKQRESGTKKAWNSFIESR